MKSKIMVNDLSDLDDHIPNCKACQFGKQNRKPLPKVVHFVEDEKWNWEDAKQNNGNWQNDMVDDVPIRGTRLLSDVYQRCNIAACEPTDHQEAMKNQNWMIAIKTKLNVDGPINKNKARLVVKGRRRRQGLTSQEGSLWPETSSKSLHNGASILIISLYVDDLLVTGNHTSLVEKFKLEMMEVFEMMDLEILKKFKVDECKEIRTPMNQKEKLNKDYGTDMIDQTYFKSTIGCLMYLTTTRPDILTVVSILSRFIHCASEMHLKVANRVIRYVKAPMILASNLQEAKSLSWLVFQIVIGKAPLMI
ncbi:Retrovirus-related Pol polyprotein from transposon RE1 [Vitis vinifera]|uniref:Retrovirus-related Pol polyprotein from transposon RE1 n=1 Tax=Vitis vinifera TaxID=29760 RepID=A0A438CAE2_VITVI|nr:Retrovirus-related Pol polyprotein from transposon RE1 [Vitis vinifera]